MKLSIPYTELSGIIKAKTEKDVAIEYVDSKTINVKTTIKESRFQNVILKKIVDKLFDLVEIEVKVKLHVNSVATDQLSVQYDAGKYADKLITFMGNKIPELNDYATFCGDNVVVVLLNRIGQLKEILSKITLHDIQFTPDGAEVTFTLN